MKCVGIINTVSEDNKTYFSYFISFQCPPVFYLIVLSLFLITLWILIFFVIFILWSILTGLKFLLSRCGNAERTSILK